jgi:hypothetical protein
VFTVLHDRYGTLVSVGQVARTTTTTTGVCGRPAWLGPSAGGSDGFDPVAASVRNQVVVRLVRMNLRRAAHAWEHRRDRPLAPLAVCFLSADGRSVMGQGEFLEVVAGHADVQRRPECAGPASVVAPVDGVGPRPVRGNTGQV